MVNGITQPPELGEYMRNFADNPALLDEQITAIMHAFSSDSGVAGHQITPLLAEISAYLR